MWILFLLLTVTFIGLLCYFVDKGNLTLSLSCGGLIWVFFILMMGCLGSKFAPKEEIIPTITPTVMPLATAEWLVTPTPTIIPILTNEYNITNYGTIIINN